MSIDINWETLTSGPDGLALAETIRAFIHDKFQEVTLPRFIQSVQVHSFDFGAVAPEVELKDICDPLPDFYDEDNDENGADDVGDPRTQASREAVTAWTLRERRQMERLSREESSRRPLSLDSQHPAMRFMMPSSDQPLSPSPGISTPGIPGGTSNLSYFHSPLATGLSGNQTPLSAMVGAHFQIGWPDISAASHGDPEGRPIARNAESSSSLSPPSTSHSTQHGHAGPSGTHQDPAKAGTSFDQTNAPNEDYAPSMPMSLRENRAEDVQIVFRVRYSGDVKLSLTADILLDYPMPSFVGIPLTLNITGLSFDGVGLLAYIKKQAHFCFLSPDDGLALVGDDDALQPETRREETSTQSKVRQGGLLQEIKVESEIGQRENGRQSLKNVGKVEKFVLEQVRRIFEDEFVYPSFWTFLV
ncbi:MAG: hypothetical protein M1825_000526 [Sarcosagium campestre]|nr:MAG: hypothetical protein M1825_000526 [Sarcosagium campestre]